MAAFDDSTQELSVYETALFAQSIAELRKLDSHSGEREENPLKALFLQYFFPTLLGSIAPRFSLDAQELETAVQESSRQTAGILILLLLYLPDLDKSAKEHLKDGSNISDDFREWTEALLQDCRSIVESIVANREELGEESLDHLDQRAFLNRLTFNALGDGDITRGVKIHQDICDQVVASVSSDLGDLQNSEESLQLLGTLTEIAIRLAFVPNDYRRDQEALYEYTGEMLAESLRPTLGYDETGNEDIQRLLQRVADTADSLVRGKARK